VLQTHRVIWAFSAPERDREPLRMENFEPGDLLFALLSEDGYTVFCRNDENLDLVDRRQFVIPDEDFARLTRQI
jgi:hypothetical protein